MVEISDAGVRVLKNVVLNLEKPGVLEKDQLVQVANISREMLIAVLISLDKCGDEATA